MGSVKINLNQKTALWDKVGQIRHQEGYRSDVQYPPHILCCALDINLFDDSIGIRDGTGLVYLIII